MDRGKNDKKKVISQLKNAGKVAGNIILATDPDICLFSVFAFCYADTAIALACEPARPLGVGNVAGVPFTQ